MRVTVGQPADAGTVSAPDCSDPTVSTHVIVQVGVAAL